MTRTKLTLAPVAAALALFAAACGGEGDPLSPVPVPKDGPPVAPIDAGSDAEPPPDAGPVKRTVTTRNPFGGPVGNLLADGDFEFSTLPEGASAQIGWLSFDSSGQRSLKTETGGICRTGLRCAVLERNRALFGRGAAAGDGAGHLASVWIRPPQGASCEVATVLLVGCDNLATYKTLEPTSEMPAADGWCEHAAAMTPKDSGVCMYVETDLDQDTTALIDSAALVPDTASAQSSAGNAWVPPAETYEMLAAIQDHIRRTTRFGRRAPWETPPEPER